MKTIVPQYIISSDASDHTGYSKLLYSSVGSDPTTGLWSATSEYTTGDTVYYLAKTGVHNGCYVQYEALQDMIDNTGTGGTDDRGQDPETEFAYWTNLGAIEAYKMFDQYNNTKTTSTSDITIRFYCKGITSVGFLNVEAKTIKITIWNASDWASCNESNKIVDGELSENQIDLTQDINNWSEYFFDDFNNVRDISKPIQLSGLYNNTVVQIDFIKTDVGDRSVGMCLPGREYSLGKIQYGVSTGIRDHSKKEFNEIFGSHYIKEGNYRKLLDCDLIVENKNLNVINTVLTQLRATPTIWQGNNNDMFFDNLLLYGVATKFNIIMSYPFHSECNLEIEGFI